MTDTAPPRSSHPYLTAPVKSTKMPGGIPYIIGNEAAERFSFYGMKGILVIFMTKYLFLMNDSAGVAMSDARANEIFHWFVTAVYFLPIFGALLADSVLGKYRTIMALSLVYCLGHGALALMGGFGDSQYWLFAGLFLIAMGSGGIKPCVTAHVGDQFGPTNRHLMEKVFNFFYFSINFGSFISTALTPVLLDRYGPHWAFGVPGVLMALATFMFWMGRRKFVHIPAGGIGFLNELFSRVGLFALLKLSVIFAFVAVFWALFDQTGSSWVLQARDMDRDWLGFTWLPSQIQAINPIMILVYIPIFTFWVYPAINKVFKLTPIRKISIGLFVMAVGFSIVSLVQGWIDAGGTPSIGWQVVAYAILTASEVMVSITCLEFSYTQAPKKMKSFVLAAFLVSVAAGNAFTAVVNRFIQSPNPASAIAKVASDLEEYRDDESKLPEGAVLDKILAGCDFEGLKFEATKNEGYRLSLPGGDGQLGTEDDLVTEYSSTGKRIALAANGFASLESQVGRSAIHSAAGLVKEHRKKEGSLPTGDAWNEIAGKLSADALTITPVEGGGYRLGLPGPDGTMGTEDDLQTTYDGEHKQTSSTSIVRGDLGRAADRIEAHWKEHDQLPIQADGEGLVKESKDAWGEAIRYRRLNKETARIWSTGPDKTEYTEDDRSIHLTAPSEGGGDEEGRWITARKAELGIVEEAADDNGAEPKLERALAVGGLVKLEGAAYFWFFTTIMLATAILFVIVGYLYKPREYIHDEIELGGDVHDG